MASEFDSQRCSDEHCQVCQLFQKLVNDGAVEVSLYDLNEHSCHLLIQPAKDNRCLRALRLDVQGARYRFISKGEESKMCDFATCAVNENIAHLAAIELKSGAAEIAAVEQLKEGIRVLTECLDSGDLKPELAAYLVVGKQADVLRFTLRDKLGAFEVNSTIVKFHILDCGDSLSF